MVAGVGVAEGPLKALALTGAEAVTRNGEVLHAQQLGHSAPPVVDARETARTAKTHRRGPGASTGIRRRSCCPGRLRRHPACATTWSITCRMSALGENSTSSLSSSATGTWPGPQWYACPAWYSLLARGRAHHDPALEQVAPVRALAGVAGQALEGRAHVRALGQRDVADRHATADRHQAQFHSVALREPRVRRSGSPPSWFLRSGPPRPRTPPGNPRTLQPGPPGRGPATSRSGLGRPSGSCFRPCNRFQSSV